MNTDEHRNPNADLGLREEGLPDSQEQRRRTADLWCVQVDAAARDDAVLEGRQRRRSCGAWALTGRRRSAEGEKGRTREPIYKASG